MEAGPGKTINDAEMSPCLPSKQRKALASVTKQARSVPVFCDYCGQVASVADICTSCPWKVDIQDQVSAELVSVVG